MSSPGPHPEQQISRRKLLQLAVLIEGGMAVIGYLVALWVGVPLTQSPFALWQTLLLGVAGTLPLLGAIALLYRRPPAWLREIDQFLDRVLPVFRRLSLPELLLICALAGFGEELLFRAAFQNLFVEAFGVIIGVIFASIVFGMFHAMTKAYFVLATLMGIYLGFIYAATHDLLLVMLIHGLYDLGVFLMLLRDSGKSSVGNSVE